MWTRIKPVLVPTHIGHLIGETDVRTAMEASWSASFAADGIKRHHALADARALRAGYLRCAVAGGPLTSTIDGRDGIEARMGVAAGQDGADPMMSFRRPFVF